MADDAGIVDYDAVVVGAGHSGLAAAFYLARAGWSVMVAERRGTVGGGCVTEEVFPGYRGSVISNSCHSLDPGIVSDMGLDRFGLKFTNPDPGSAILYPDGRALVPWADPRLRRAEIAKFARSEGDVSGWYSLLEFFHKVAASMEVSVFEAPPTFDEVYGRLTSSSSRRAFEQVMFGSAMDIISERITSPELQAFIAGTACATNLVGPYTPGSAYILLQRPLYEASLNHGGLEQRNDMVLSNASPLGGMGAITCAMASANEALGVKVLVNQPVTSILCRGGSAYGVTLGDGREVRSRVVVAAVNPKLVLTELVPAGEFDTDFVQRARAMKMAGSSAKVHLALSGTPRFAAARTAEENELFLKTNFRMVPSVEAIEEGYHNALLGRWSRRPCVLGVIPSAVDPSLTPPGCHFVSLSVRSIPYHLSEGTWDQQRQALGEAVVDVVQEYIPNLHDILEDFHVLTPWDLEHEYGFVEGNAAHGDLIPGQILASRPLPECSGYRTPIRGLYLSGVGTWPGNYISGLTGANAAQTVLRDSQSNGCGTDTSYEFGV